MYKIKQGWNCVFYCNPQKMHINETLLYTVFAKKKLKKIHPKMYLKTRLAHRNIPKKIKAKNKE